MSKRCLALFLWLVPLLSFAESISFNPPPSDISVGYLATLFGIVDGVLHGTGSQIIGAMFGVFNAAVMALGGIIVTYTMIISTVNTAHEGEMLGKEWNSIWIPLRATLGFALLIPKATGYCLMQIGVMWVIVQGTGAADKVWNAALDYLNRGGVIIKQQSNPTAALLSDPGGNQIIKGAMAILSGQVCMLAMQNILNNQLQNYRQQSPPACPSLQNNDCTPAFSEKCVQAAFCNSATVPSFIDTIDIMAAERTAEAATAAAVAAAVANKQSPNSVTPSTPFVTMPNFSSTATPYQYLNGICGVISWNLVTDQGNSSSFSTGQWQTVQQSRATAVQQLYSDLLTLAQVIVNNDPQISSTPLTPPPPPQQEGQGVAAGASPPTAPGVGSASGGGNPSPDSPPTTPFTQPFGEPLANGSPCTSSPCSDWGIPSGNPGQALLLGSELQTALADYNGIMQPTLVLMAENFQAGQNRNSTQFIKQAKQQGWIMAGSFFFELVSLNNKNTVTANNNPVDSSSGLDQSNFDLSTLTNSYSPGSTTCKGSDPSNPVTEPTYNKNWVSNSPPTYYSWCWMFGLTGGNISTATGYLNNLLSCQTSGGNQTPPDPKSNTTPQQAPNSNCVFGYLQNALMMQTGANANTTVSAFNNLAPNFGSFSYNPPWLDIPCGGVFFIGCIGYAVMFPAIILLQLAIKIIISLLVVLINDLVMKMIMVPIKGFLTIFVGAVNIISQPGINPIIALANMGTYYINFVANLFQIQLYQIFSYVASIYGILLLPAVAITAPLMISWASIMLSIGFVTAYYVPMVPYLIFTFGSLAWFMAVIEAVVAAPILALGIIHPEGQHKILGKSEQGIMILMNVFLRPSMMIFGYITAISMTYIGVWVLNAGFDTAAQFVMNQGEFATSSANANYSSIGQGVYGSDQSNVGYAGGVSAGEGSGIAGAQTNVGASQISGGYVGWAAVFGYFFMIMLYTSTYMTIVEKAFTLISTLPDQVLRWIGGAPEKHGEQAAQWAGEMKGKVEKAGGETEKAAAAVGKGIITKGGQQAAAIKEGISAGSSESEGGQG